MAERRVVIVITGKDEVLDLAKDLLLGYVDEMVLRYQKETHRMFDSHEKLDHVRMGEDFDG